MNTQAFEIIVDKLNGEAAVSGADILINKTYPSKPDLY